MHHHRPWLYQQQDVDPARKQKPTCQVCGARIIWVVSAKNPDKRIPCQPEWEYGDGKKTLIALDERMRGIMIVKAGPEVRGRQPHFGHCRNQAPATFAPQNPEMWLFKSP